MNKKKKPDASINKKFFNSKKDFEEKNQLLLSKCQTIKILIKNFLT